MKKLLLSLTALVFSATLMAQKPDDVAKFKLETIDFGKVKFKTPPTATFIVKNISNQPLIIETANPACGCTLGDYTKSPIAPGKEGWIKATYNAATLGSFTKGITVKFAGINESKTITIKGEVLSAEDYAKVKPATKQVAKPKTVGAKKQTRTPALAGKVSRS